MIDPADITNRIHPGDENRQIRPLRGGSGASGELIRDAACERREAFAKRRERAFRAEPGIRNHETSEQFPK